MVDVKFGPSSEVVDVVVVPVVVVAFVVVPSVVTTVVVVTVVVEVFVEVEELELLTTKSCRGSALGHQGPPL